jgi:hypothetical protein
MLFQKVRHLLVKGAYFLELSFEVLQFLTEQSYLIRLTVEAQLYLKPKLDCLSV